MYEKKIELKTKDRCNYVIEMSPNDNNIFFSLNEQGYILPKEKFLSLTEKSLNELSSEKIQIFNLKTLLPRLNLLQIIKTFLSVIKQNL